MFGFGTGDGIAYHSALYLEPAMYGVILLGIVGSTPWLPWLRQRLGALGRRLESAWALYVDVLLGCGRLTAYTFLLLASAVLLSAATYNPFIYFRF
jgi:hypothetical protein